MRRQIVSTGIDCCLRHWIRPKLAGYVNDASRHAQPSLCLQASQLGEQVGERGAELSSKAQDTAGTVAQTATDAAIGIKDTTVEHGSKASFREQCD